MYKGPQTRDTQSQSVIPRTSRLPVSRSLLKPPNVAISDNCTGIAQSRDIPSTLGRYRGVQHRRSVEGAEQVSDLQENSKRLQDANFQDQTPVNNVTDHAEQESKQIPATSLRETNPKPKLDQAQSQQRPRPALSDRTIESLAKIPPSPSPRRRKSGFFPEGSPVRAASCQGSSATVAGPQITSRVPPPLTVISSHLYSTVKPRPPSKAKLATQNVSPKRRTVSSTSSTSLKKVLTTKIPSGSKTLVTRPTQQKSRVEGLFPPPASAARSGNKASLAHGANVRGSLPVRPSLASGRRPDPFKPPTKTVHPSAMRSHSAVINSTWTEDESAGPVKNKTSSAVLKETIAKARATHRQAQGETLAALRVAVDNDPTVLEKRLETARTDGRLNISGLSLGEFPSRIISAYDRSALDFADDAAFQTVALTKLIAADNDIELIHDCYFPAVQTGLNAVFGMLESLDMHGNRLKSLPEGLGSLESLTSLNLSRNELSNTCLDIIVGIPSLRELHLAGNKIGGTLRPELFSMKTLETLDLTGNAITEVPPVFDPSLQIRKLLLAKNRLKVVTSGAMGECHLVELDLSHNKLLGTLLGNQISLPSLQILDVSRNALTKLSHEDELQMPELQVLHVQENRFEDIPNLSRCTRLMALSAAANNIGKFPNGMTSLPLLANVDFSRNGLRTVDECIGMMDGLKTLNIANNPIPQRSLMTMATDTLKKEMRERVLES